MPSKIDIMLELEKRGKLPENKKPILDELRKRGHLPPIQATEDHPISEAYKTQESSVRTLTDPLISGQDVRQTISNIPSSAYNVAKDIGTAALHPVQTAQGLGQIFSEAVGQTMPSQMAKSTPALDAMKNLLSERYGSPESLKQTIIKDPVGFAMDLSTVLSGGGAIASKVPTLSKAGKVLSATGRISEPLNVAKTAVKGPAVLTGKAIPYRAAERLYESGLKPSTTLSDVAKAKRIETALKEGIPISKSGLQKSKGIINELNNEIKTRVTNATETINREKLLSPVEKLKTTYQETQALPAEGVSEVEKVLGEFKTAHPESISVKKVQVMKQDLNKRLDDFYKKASRGDTIKPNEWAETRAALADGMREQLTEILPELKNLNKREGSLIELNKSLRQAVNRIDNKNILSLLGSTYAAAGGILGGTKGAIVGLISNYVINNPKISSRLAIALYKAKKASLTSKGGKLTPVRQAAFQAGRITNTTQGE